MSNFEYLNRLAGARRPGFRKTEIQAGRGIDAASIQRMISPGRDSCVVQIDGCPRTVKTTELRVTRPDLF